MLHEMKRVVCKLRLLFLLQGVTFLASGQPVSLPKDGGPAMSTNRLGVAILEFENRTGDLRLEWGRAVLNRLMAGALRDVKALRLLGGVDYALGTMNIKPGAAIAASQAQKVGEIIDARRVIWGSYQRDGDKWRATARVLNVGAGTNSTELTVAGRDWHEVRDLLVDQVLKELAITPALDEQKKIRERLTTSSEALQIIGQSELAYEQKLPLGSLEGDIRKAISADPECALAYAMLASILETRKEMAGAEKAARHAVELKPDWYGAHRTLAWIQLAERKYQEAEKEFQNAIDLNPDDAQSFERLGDISASQHLPGKAIENFQKALESDPFSANCHAHLGLTFAAQGNREKAITELKAAERLISANDLDPIGDMNTEMFLAEGYIMVFEAPSAVDHLERYIKLAKSQKMDPQELKPFETSLDEWKRRLAPVYFHLTPPTNYSEQTFATVLREKLSPEEIALVTNPMTWTPEMERWAKDLTAGATNDLQKARMLFDGLARHIDVGVKGNPRRTAAEVFADWKKPGKNFICMEYALLYVSLARSVELNAYFVSVEQLCDGQKLLHACAWVDVNGQTLLVDPAYRWFGAPHKKFSLLDDVQTAAGCLSCQGNLRGCRIASKLAPDQFIVEEILFFVLAKANRWDEARAILPALERLDTMGETTRIARGTILWQDGKRDQAIALLREAAKMSPGDALAHVILGQFYEQQAQLRLALQSYKDALNCNLDHGQIERVRAAVARLNEAIEHGAPDKTPH